MTFITLCGEGPTPVTRAAIRAVVSKRFETICAEHAPISPRHSVTTDLTTGPPLKRIVVFAGPLFAGLLFQQAYQLADALVVGRVIGMHALAAVGASGSIVANLTRCSGAGGRGRSMISRVVATRVPSARTRTASVGDRW